MTTVTLTFPNDWTPLDLLLFRHFKAEVPGLPEATLAANPGLAEMGVYPPRGTKVIVTVPTQTQRQPTRPAIQLYD